MNFNERFEMTNLPDRICCKAQADNAEGGAGRPGSVRNSGAPGGEISAFVGTIDVCLVIAISREVLQRFALFATFARIPVKARNGRRGREAVVCSVSVLRDIGHRKASRSAVRFTNDTAALVTPNSLATSFCDAPDSNLARMA